MTEAWTWTLVNDESNTTISNQYYPQKQSTNHHCFHWLITHHHCPHFNPLYLVCLHKLEWGIVCMASCATVNHPREHALVTNPQVETLYVTNSHEFYWHGFEGWLAWNPGARRSIMLPDADCRIFHVHEKQSKCHDMNSTFSRIGMWGVELSFGAKLLEHTP